MSETAARHDDNGVAATQRICMPSWAPRTGQDPSTQRARVAVIVRTLDALVRAGRPETGRSSDHFLPRVKAHLDSLMRELDAYLETHGFLQLSIEPRAVLHHGRRLLHVRGNRGLLAAILSAGDVVEVLFRRGVCRAEIQRFVQALHRSPRVPDGVHSAAAALWECDLRSIHVCSVEDRLPVRPARFDSFDLANATVEQADELAFDVTLDPAYTAAAEVDGMQQLDLDALPQSALGAVVASTSADGALPEHFMPDGETAVAELGRVLIAMQLTERDTGALELGRELLVRILDMRMANAHHDAVHELLTELWKQSRHRAVAITFRRVVAALCRERHALVFGKILSAARARPAEAGLVRKILELLGGTALEPLWTLYQECTDDKQRAALGEVLTAVVWKDPTELVRHVEMRPWNEVRDLIFLLGQLGGSKILPALRKWTTHEDSRVRIEVVRALTTSDNATATGILCDMLADPDYRVRQTSVWSLATRNDRRALVRLKQIVFDDVGFRGRSLDERDDFFRTCGRLADAGTLELFAGLVQQRQIVPRGWKADLRRGAALALGESGWPRARGLLEKASKTRDPRLREACRSALSAMTPSTEVDASDPRQPAPRSRGNVARSSQRSTPVDTDQSDAAAPWAGASPDVSSDAPNASPDALADVSVHASADEAVADSTPAATSARALAPTAWATATDTPDVPPSLEVE